MRPKAAHLKPAAAMTSAAPAASVGRPAAKARLENGPARPNLATPTLPPVAAYPTGFVNYGSMAGEQGEGTQASSTGYSVAEFAGG